jgi:inhibitor of cysteine peptidase
MTRMPTAAAIGAAVIATAILSGCSQTTAGRPAGPVELRAENSGKTLQLAAGTVVRVTLASNPSTGYSWVLKTLDAKVVEQTAQKFVPPENQIPGKGGQEVWTFTAKAAGTTPLRLEYRRPWEKDVAPGEVFEAKLVVR